MAARDADAVLYLGRRYVRAAALFRFCCRRRSGVCVRLLLDDTNTPGSDDTLRCWIAILAIEVRLFNPSFVCYARWDI